LEILYAKVVGEAMFGLQRFLSFHVAFDENMAPNNMLAQMLNLRYRGMQCIKE
jgi:hypothetical protein